MQSVTPKEALAKAVDLAGGPTALAKFISERFSKISAQAVCDWAICPPRRVIQVETATNGEVSRHDLRPDLYPRELVSPASSKEERTPIVQWVEELLDLGLTEADISALTGTKQSTVMRIRCGDLEDPGHTITKAIAKLHIERCARKAAA